MEELELIYDHYKDTFDIIKCNEKKRDRLFVVLFVLVLILFLCSIMPETIYSMIEIIVNSEIENMIMFSFDIIQTFLWIIIFYTAVKYFQIIVHINRSYEYLANIEVQIDNKIQFEFCREGKQYLDNYPMLLDYIYQMYITFFPVFIVFCITIKIVFELLKNINFLSVLDTIIYIFICILIILYYRVVHPKKNK